MREVTKYKKSGCVLVVTEDTLDYKATFYYPRGSGLPAQTIMGSLVWVYRAAGRCEYKFLQSQKEAASSALDKAAQLARTL